MMMMTKHSKKLPAQLSSSVAVAKITANTSKSSMNNTSNKLVVEEFNNSNDNNNNNKKKNSKIRMNDMKLVSSNGVGKTQAKLTSNLHSAAEAGKVELVRLLLRCGANVNAQDDEFGNTPLHQAAWNGFSETVQVLCKHRADTSIKNKAQFTALHMACQQGHNQCARLLLMANARSEAKNSYGDTPLHTAARYGHAGVARILLSAKCNPNQVNKNHDTPLHISAAMGRRKLTKIFMQNGAEPAIKNKQNETPMDIALRKNLIDIQELIANPPAPVTRKRASKIPEHNQHERYGHLYGSFDDASNKSSLVRLTSRRATLDQISSDDEGDIDSGDELTRRFASRLKLADRQIHSRRRIGHELPVDAPELNERTTGRKGRLSSPSVNNNNNYGHSTSMNSLAHHRTLPPGRQQHQQHQLRQLRHKTLAGGVSADLHLLLAMQQGNERQKSNGNRAPSSLELDPAGRSIAPDVRELQPPASGGSRATLEVHSSGAAPGNTPVIKEVLDERVHQLPPSVNEMDENKEKEEVASSPAGSLRSSQLSKSRGRLVIRRRLNRHKSSLLVRRPALGTCVGKLSLLRLRNAANKRNKLLQQHEQPKQLVPENAVENEDVGERKQAVGRRQERLRAANSTNTETDTHRVVLRALNGTRLLATRPLASLSDDTQLYAIPKKSKLKQQQQQVVDSEEQQQPETSQQEQRPVRVPSDGPALTSDGCHSSSTSGSSSSFPTRATPSNTSRAAERLAVVGVSGIDLYAPGYSSVLGREQQPPDEATTCLCEEAPVRGTATQQQPATSSLENSRRITDKRQVVDPVSKANETSTSKGGKLRSLFQLRDLRNKSVSRNHHQGTNSSQEQQLVATTTTNGNLNGAQADGYFAYSPVVQSSSELVKESLVSTANQTATSNINITKTKTSKKSWLKSKFSLSSSNIQQSSVSVSNLVNADSIAFSSKNQVIKDDYLKRANGKQPEELTGIEQHGPERRAELIRINCALTDSNLAQKCHHHPSNTEIIVRPKSSLASPMYSSSTTELIAAQKSLAAAAAAKVKRDRLVKMSNSANFPANEQSLPQAEVDQEAPTGMLTVKTNSESHPFSWSANSNSNNNVVAGKYMIGQSLSHHHHHHLLHQQLHHHHQHHRSGSNSVGMSDSSPSNNGADSDNSLQTNSGSMNTDNTSATGQPLTTNTTTTQNQTSSPLGILSRILLNNNNKSYTTSNIQANNKQIQKSPLKDAHTIERASANLRPSQQTTISSSGSSALSSPGMSSRGSAESAEQQTSGQQKLDQLTSRSRCPIVIAKSNELPMASARSQSSPPPVKPPPLPAKSAMKPPFTSRLYNNNIRAPSVILTATDQHIMNGLPRVSSYTQISSLQNGYQTSSSNESPALCNFHAFTRGAGIAPPYTGGMSTYLPTYSALATNARYSLEQPTHIDGLKQYPHHLSHHDLRSIENSSHLELNLPASAINYEYFLEAPPLTTNTAQYPHYAFRYPDGAYHQQLHHDDSIYIAQQYTQTINGQVRDTSTVPPLSSSSVSGSSNSATSVSVTTITSELADQHKNGILTTNGMMISNLNSRQQQQRPKSSLDTILLSSSSNNHQDTTNSTTTTDTNNSNGPTRQLSATNFHNNKILNQGRHLQDQMLQNQRHPRIPSDSSQGSNLQSLDQSANLPSSHSNRKYLPNLYHAYPYNHHHHHATTVTEPSYLYSTENTIYASDQQSPLGSDLTVLPQTTSSNDSSRQQQSYQQSTVKVLSEGGSDCNTESPASSNGSCLVSARKNSLNSSPSLASASVSSSSVSSSQRQFSPVTTTTKLAPTTLTERDERRRSSWTPTQPFKSLVQVNLSNQSTSSSRMPALQADANQSSTTNEISPLSHLHHLHNHRTFNEKHDDDKFYDDDDDDDEREGELDGAKKINPSAMTNNINGPTYLLNCTQNPLTSSSSLASRSTAVDHEQKKDSLVKSASSSTSSSGRLTHKINCEQEEEEDDNNDKLIGQLQEEAATTTVL